MLEHLRARNLGLIRDGVIDPHPGLTVITGETGAGKTLLLGALRLLLGETPDPGVVGPFGDEAQADGVLVDGDELGVSRVVPAEGRSRSYIDGAVASSAALAERVGSRVEIIGQHDQLELRRRRRVLSLLDANLDEKGVAALSAYQAAWSELTARLEDAERLGGSEAELARELDLVRFQASEIDSAGFVSGEDVELEQKESRLRNANEIRAHLEAALEAVATVDDAAGELLDRMRRVSRLDPAASGLVEAAETVAVTASELSRDLQLGAEELVDDPAVTAAIEERLTLLGELKRKYGRTIEEILDFGRRAGERATILEGLLARASTIGDELDRARSAVTERGADLTAARARTAGRLEKTIAAHLAEVGLENASIRFAIASIEPGASGADRVELHFASHEGLSPGPLTKVASGGELSRLILAVSLATSVSDSSTLVFDEVDAGVGGATALAMGQKLSDLAVGRQVLCVTHLPQVAAFADSHYVVTRSGAEASVGRVSGTERLEELSRMIAGLPESDRGQQAAIELLELSGK